MALKTRPKPPKKRSQTLLQTLFHSLRKSLRALLGGLGLLGSLGMLLAPLPFEPHVGPILDVLEVIFNKVG